MTLPVQSLLGQDHRNIEKEEIPLRVISARTTDPNRVQINYRSGEITLTQVDLPEGRFFRAEMEGHIPVAEAGNPEIPVVSRIIDLTGRDISSITISNVVTERIYPSERGIAGTMIPVQPGLTKNGQQERGRFVRNSKVYESDRSPLADTVSVSILGTIRGRRIGQLQVNPLIYHPSSNFIELIRSMDISIQYIDRGYSPDSKGTLSSASLDELLSKGLLDYNPDFVIPGFSLQPAGLVIVSDTTMRRHLKPLVEWKTQKGFRVIELYVGANKLKRTFADIKDTLTYIYNNSTDEFPAPEYLIIAGDLNIIPYSDGTSRLSDLYYAEFDGGADYLPDMFYGRLPAKDTTQMKSIVAKIVEYEKFSFPDTSRHYEKAVALAGYDAGHVAEMNGQVSYASQYLNEENNILPEIFPHSLVDTVRTAGFDSVKSLLRSGVGFVNYTGHGTSTSWLYTGIDYTLVSSLTNSSRYPVIISNACQTARFNVDNCFGSTFVRARNKGALAFIGCTMDSYWKEDFYWAVGVSPITATPTYEGSGAGFYDRLFHTHDESPSNWYTSLGKILFAGNLAVSSSTSSLKRYYWETYTLLGDPSIIPYIGSAAPFGIELPDTLPLSLRNLSFTTDPFAYAAISHFDTLWDASHSSPSGSVNLEIPDIDKDSCLVIITGQNRRPYIKTIYFSQPDTAWLSITDVNTADPHGNNDGFADYSETVSLRIDLQNAGLAGATDVYSRLSSGSPYVEIIEDSLFVGSLPGMSASTIPSAFRVRIADSIPDMAIVNFSIEVYYGSGNAIHNFDISLHAPEPAIISCLVDDDLLGNGNGLAEAGESFDMVFRIGNWGSSPVSGTVTLSDISPSITFENTVSDIQLFPPGAVTEVRFQAQLSANVPDAELVNFDIYLDCSPYSDSRRLGIISGNTIEDFETGTFSSFPWLNGTAFPWIIDQGASYSNAMAARSAAISHNQESVLSIYINIPEDDTLRFWYRVSSEANYDWFSFSVDSVRVFREAGESGWKLRKVALATGVHYLEWKYRKDESLSSGSDAAWLDFIRFPEISFLKTDIAVNKIISPESPGKSNQEEIIEVSLTNLGSEARSGFDLAYVVDDNAPVVEYFSVEFLPGDTLEVSFSQAADLSAEGSYDLKVYMADQDDYLLNDTAKIQLIITGINDIPVNNDTFVPAPNPFHDVLRIISVGDFNDVTFELYTIDGILIYRQFHRFITEGQEITIPSGPIREGIYLLYISSPGFRANYKVIKQSGL